LDLALTISEALRAAKFFMPDVGLPSADVVPREMQDVADQQRGAGPPTYALDPYTINVHYGASAGVASSPRRSKRSSKTEEIQRQEAADEITAEEVCQIIKVAIERLKAEIFERLEVELTAVKQEMHSGRAEDHKELDRVIQLVAAHMWLINSAVKNLAPEDQKSEMAAGWGYHA
jgi:hypothetical protein